MRSLLVLTMLLGSLATACQKPDVTGTPQTSEASLGGNSTSKSAPTTPQTPQSSSKSEPQPSAQSKNQVATIQNSPAESQQSCQISAFLIDKDPEGVNVRSGPGDENKIIGKLPTNTVGVIVNIGAAQGNWVKLTKAESPEKIEFQGTGWVYTQLLGTSTRGYGTKGVSVYASSSTQSEAIGLIPPERRVKLLGCDQSWALVEYEGLKGWIAPDAQCPNPLTTCP